MLIEYCRQHHKSADHSLSAYAYPLQVILFDQTFPFWIITEPKPDYLLDRWGERSPQSRDIGAD